MPAADAPEQPDTAENDSPAAGASLSRSGPGNWGVAARWFMFAILAAAFCFALYALRR
jgi:hypothetical protein